MLQSGSMEDHGEAVPLRPIPSDATSAEPHVRTAAPVVCVGASSGGHLTELLALLAHDDLWPAPPRHLITTTLPKPGSLGSWETVTAIGECDRRTWFEWPRVLWRAWNAAHRSHPDVFVTTGSMPMLFVAASVKLRGGKVIWIDSIARMERLSVSANVASYFVDLCLTQSPEVAETHPRAVYAGEVF